MNDEQVIQAAYEEALRKLFYVYLENRTLGAKDADTRLTKGLVNARKSRDRALQLIKEAPKSEWD
jgi:hypothetical protein